MMDMIMTQKGLELLGKAMQAGEQMLKAGWPGPPAATGWNSYQRSTFFEQMFPF